MKTTEQQATAEVATIEKKEVSPMVVDMNGPLPDLNEAVEYPFDLMADYWTPEKLMESKRVFFDKITSRTIVDDKTGDQIELDCAYFIEVTKDGAKTISNGSKRLVGAIQAHNIQHGTPLLIVYQGKKRNVTNQFQSDNWSVKIMSVNIK